MLYFGSLADIAWKVFCWMEVPTEFLTGHDWHQMLSLSGELFWCWWWQLGLGVFASQIASQFGPKNPVGLWEFLSLLPTVQPRSY